MESHEILREVFQKCSPKEVAEEMGLSLPMIYKWAQPPGEAGSGVANPLDRIEAILKCTSDPLIAQWICERSGGFFVKNPSSDRPDPNRVVPATNRIIQDFAEMLSVIARSAVDNSINKEESRSIRRRWEDLKSVTEGFVRCCEEGDFTAKSLQKPTVRH